ncbi:MAG: oligosaccharide flippase family protein [Lachnospiraceae bacterium]|nr:oligosaccharide flippase family protein [Lachnospiraceae bacterium]
MSKYNNNKIVCLNLIGKIILNGINFFVTPLFTRMLGTENYGLFSVYLTWQSIFQIIIGLQSQSIIGNASSKFVKDERAKLLSSNAFMVSLIFAFSLFIVLFLKNTLVRFLGLPILVIILMLFHAYTGYGVNIVTGTWAFDKEADKNFVASILLSIVNILFSFLLINRIKMYNLKYIGRIVGSALPTLVFGSICIVIVLIRGKTLYNKKYWKYTLTFSIPIVFHGLSNLILSQSDRVMLQKMTSLNVVGIYSIVYTLTNVLVILWEAFNVSWVPFFYEDLSKKNINLIRIKSFNYLKVYNCLVIGFLLVSPEVYLFYASKEFASGVDVIPYLAIGAYFIFLYSFSVNYKYYKGKTISIAIGTVGSGFFNLLINFLLIPRYGIDGAAFATCISYAILWLFHQIGASRMDKEDYPYTFSFFMPSIWLILLTAFLSFTLLRHSIAIRWGIACIDGFILLRTVYKKGIW